jgi:hypothetical protein
MDEARLHGRIEDLVSEGHLLWERKSAGEATDDDRQRLDSLKVALDQCWNLLRQRRALREAGLDPEVAAGARLRRRRALPAVAQGGLRSSPGDAPAAPDAARCHPGSGVATLDGTIVNVALPPVLAPSKRR